MAFAPIAFTAPNYRDYKNHWIKAYQPGTTTPKTMALNSDATVIVIKAQLNKDGFIVSAGDALVIPYINGDYDLWLFPTETEADANDTSGALRLADNLNAENGEGGGANFAEEIKTLSTGQTAVTFSGINARTASIYVGSKGVDRGRLFRGIDYDATSDSTIELEESFPSGTFCVGISDLVTVGETVSFVKKYLVLNAAVNDSGMSERDTVNVKERVSGFGGGGIWDAVDITTVTPNTYNIIQCLGNSDLALVLREDKAVLASQYTDDPTDIGAAWNFADAHANAMGWPLFIPAGSYGSSIGLTWDGIFHDIIGAGVDICKITFTNDVQGIRFRGGRLEGIQFVGIGALSTQVGVLMEQNQRHILSRVKATKFQSGFKFSGGNLSSFNDIFGIDNNQHGFVADMDTPDNNSITVGMMDLKGNGINGLEFTNGTPSNVSQQWKGGIISCQSNGGKGFNLSGRGHELTFYDEFNGLLSLMDVTCEASQVRMLFGVVTDNGSENDVITHRQGPAEAISHSNLETEALKVRDRDFTGQFSQKQLTNNKLTISEDGSSSSSTVEFRSLLGPALNVAVKGSVNGQVITNTNNSALILPANGNVMQVSNTASTTITSVTAPAVGLEFTLIFLDGNTTVQNNSNIKLSGGVDFVAATNDTLKLTYDGNKYYQTGGSVN